MAKSSPLTGRTLASWLKGDEEDIKFHVLMGTLMAEDQSLPHL